VEIIRYINGERLECENIKNYIVECNIILETIEQVNERLNCRAGRRNSPASCNIDK